MNEEEPPAPAVTQPAEISPVEATCAGSDDAPGETTGVDVRRAILALGFKPTSIQ